MNLSKEYWMTGEMIDTHTLYGRNMVEKYIDVSSKGYVKRNSFMPSQIQVIVKDVYDAIICFYLPEEEAEELIIPIKQAPPNATPELYWTRYWELYK